MEAVIAGWAMGYVMGIVATVAITFLLTRNDGPSWLAGVLDSSVSRPLLAIPVFVGTSLIWTMIGLALGAIYDVGGFHDGASGLGSPSIGFAGMMAALAAMPLPLLVLLWRSSWWLWAGQALLFVLLFGWAMPHLAGQ